MSKKERYALFLALSALMITIIAAFMALAIGRIGPFICGWIVTAGVLGCLVGALLEKAPK